MAKGPRAGQSNRVQDSRAFHSGRVTRVPAPGAAARAAAAARTRERCAALGASWRAQPGGAAPRCAPRAAPTCEHTIFTPSFSSHSFRKSIITCGGGVGRGGVCVGGAWVGVGWGGRQGPGQGGRQGAP